MCVLFRSVRKVAKKRLLICHAFLSVPPSVCPHISTRLSPGQIYMKFRIEDFIKIGREIPNLVKIGQRYRALYMET